MKAFAIGARVRLSERARNVKSWHGRPRGKARQFSATVVEYVNNGTNGDVLLSNGAIWNVSWLEAEPAPISA